MKHCRALLIIVLSVLLLFCGCSNGIRTVKITPEIENAVVKAIIKDNKSVYLEGECPAEGHIIYGAETKNNIIYIYAYISFAYFGFVNGNFIEVSGGNNPAVFELNAENYELIKVLYPEDGEYYALSTEKLFPKKYASKALDLSDSDYKNLNNQLDKYAEKYLKSINREAVIGRWADFDCVLPTDLGISVDVSNALSEIEKYHSNYPFWIGNKEIVENGVRYVYAVDYDKENNIIIYSKYEYDNPEILLEKITVDSLTGKIVD